MKKAIYSGLFILLISSILFDLQKPHHTYSKLTYSTSTRSEYKISYPVGAGDTVLSIVEKTSDSQAIPNSVTIIINDFRTLNPQVNPYQLVQHTTYFSLSTLKKIKILGINPVSLFKRTA